MTADEGIRFADILTTGSAVANYLGLPDVTADHLLDAVALLQGTKSMADLGRPVSPLVPRPRAAAGGVQPEVKTLVQRWHERVGSADALLARDDLSRLVAELRVLGPSTNGAPRREAT